RRRLRAALGGQAQAGGAARPRRRGLPAPRVRRAAAAQRQPLVPVRSGKESTMITFRALRTECTDEGYFTRMVERDIDDLPAGDVLIRVHWSSLNYKDALSATGNRGVTRHYPHTPGI